MGYVEEEVVRAAGKRYEPIPAVYKTVTRQVVETEATQRETNATTTKITEIQNALKTAGFNPGNLDGVIRATTMRVGQRSK